MEEGIYKDGVEERGIEGHAEIATDIGRSRGIWMGEERDRDGGWRRDREKIRICIEGEGG